MSRDAFKTFLAKVQQDEALKKELRAAGGAQGIGIAELARFAAGKGYQFKAEDVSGELTPSQLEGVAGGLIGLTADKFYTAIKYDGAYLSPTGSLMFKF
jgi:predicted ribosomally synthesized peptide with nif11-like leader